MLQVCCYIVAVMELFFISGAVHGLFLFMVQFLHELFLSLCVNDSGITRSKECMCTTQLVFTIFSLCLFSCTRDIFMLSLSLSLSSSLPLLPLPNSLNHTVSVIMNISNFCVEGMFSLTLHLCQIGL